MGDSASGDVGLVEALQASPSRLVDTARAVAWWLAAVDGPPITEELQAIDWAFAHEPGYTSLAQIEAVLGSEEGRLRELPRLLRLLRSQRSPGRTPSLLDVFLRVVGADGRLGVVELHALMLLSDLLAAPPSLLRERFEVVLGLEFEAPVDLSEPRWFVEREARINARLAAWKRSQADAREAERQRAERLAAQSLLGVTDDSTPLQIKAAWRRLSRQYHPDRQTDADPSRQRQAAEQFHAVQQAWSLLREEA